MTEFTTTDKRSLCGPIVTTEGRGYVCGAQHRFATVQYDDGTTAEYAWSTIVRIRQRQTPDPDALAHAPWAAMAYHAGQTDPLYAYGSSGAMVPGLARAARQAADVADDLAANATDDTAGEFLLDGDALRALTQAAELDEEAAPVEHRRAIVTDTGRPHLQHYYNGRGEAVIRYRCEACGHTGRWLKNGNLADDAHEVHRWGDVETGRSRCRRA